MTTAQAYRRDHERVNDLLDFEDEAGSAVLGDGYRVDIRIVVRERANVLTLPVGSLFMQNGRPSVFVVRDGRAALTVVETGQRNTLDVEVVRGLNEGDEVVVYPADVVRDGVRLAVRD